MWAPERNSLGEPLYLGIATRLADDIAGGRLRPGDRLPTQRELSTSLGVSLGTVTRAYAEAELRGLVRGETGRGTFVAEHSEAGSVPSLEAGDGVVDLSINLPMDWESPDLGRELSALAARGNLQELLRYQPPAGAWAHRAAGAGWIRRNGLEVPAENVIVCSGAQNAITVALASLAEPGDTILTGELTYPGIKVIASFLHLRLHGLRMDDQGILPEAFAHAARRRGVKALYCIPTIQNPTCAVMSPERRKEIGEIARSRGVAIIEDDAYKPLVDDVPPAIASFAPEQGYFVASLSKAIAGGLRIAYLAAPSRAVERISQAVWANQWSVPPLMAELVSGWIAGGTANDTIARKRAETALRQEIVSEILGRRIRTHSNSFHVWLELPPSWSAAAFSIEARKRGVAISPGSDFAVGDTPLSDRGCRISLGAVPGRTALRRGLERVAGLVDQPRPFTAPMV